MDFSVLVGFALLALPPLVLWVIFWRKRLAEPEPTKVLAQLFLFGILASLPLFALREINFSFPSWALLILFAWLEESLKGLALIFGVEFNRARFDKWEDGFEFAIMIALGFAFAENIFYFLRQYLDSGISLNFWQIYLFRSLGTVLGHIIFTGTFGYFYACAYVKKGLVPFSKHEKPLAHFCKNIFKILRRPLHITLYHLLPQRDSALGHSSGEVIIEGFLLAIILHTLFNALLHFEILDQSFAFLAVPILLGGGVWYFYRFKQ